MWTAIDISHYSRHYIDLLLSRSREAPLRLSIGQPMSHSTYYPPVNTRSVKKSPMKAEDLAELWTRASLLNVWVGATGTEMETPHGTNQGIVYCPRSLFALPTPLLVSLQISVVPHLGWAPPPTLTASLESPFLGGDHPKLRSLTLIRIAPEWDESVFRNLTFLKVHDPQSRCPFQKLMEVLLACPDMRHLELHSAIEAFSDWNLNAQQATFPRITSSKLETLEFYDRLSENIFNIVCQLHLPSIRVASLVAGLSQPSPCPPGVP